MTNDNTTNSAVHEQNLEGVKGWLLFFCIYLTVLIPNAIIYKSVKLWNIFSPLFNYIDMLKISFAVETGLGIGIIIFSIYAGVALWAKRKNAVKLAKRFIVTLVFFEIFRSIFTFVTAIITLSFKSPHTADTFAMMIGGIFWSIIHFAAWNAYLISSKRVKTTYPLEAEETD